MGKNRAPHLPTNPKNRTGWLHFQRWTPLQPGLLLPGMLEEEQPKEKLKGKRKWKLLPSGLWATKEALKHPLTAAMLLRLGTQFPPSRRAQDI